MNGTESPKITLLFICIDSFCKILLFVHINSIKHCFFMTCPYTLTMSFGHIQGPLLYFPTLFSCYSPATFLIVPHLLSCPLYSCKYSTDQLQISILSFILLHLYHTYFFSLFTILAKNTINVMSKSDDSEHLVSNLILEDILSLFTILYACCFIYIINYIEMLPVFLVSLGILKIRDIINFYFTSVEMIM